MKVVKLFSVAILAMTFCMTSCTGEDGKDGIDGINGIDGTNGTNGADGADGADGQDGENGVGFDELTKFGYITLELEGTRADDVQFQDSTSFKFTPVAIPDANHGTSSMVMDDLIHTFEFLRFFSAPGIEIQESYMFMHLEIANLGEASESLRTFGFELSDYSIIGDDNKYFQLSNSIHHDFLAPNPESPISNIEISDVAYDAETNHLTFSYALTVDAIANATGNDLNISGTVDVTLLEPVEENINF